MGWKDWPYWLKGGIIGLIVGLITLISKLILSFMFIDDTGNAPIYTLGIKSFLLSQLLGFLGTIIIGLVIGWVYGKIKNR